jgi:hypothetical protein
LSQPTVPKASFSLVDAEPWLSAKIPAPAKNSQKIPQPRCESPENLLLFKVLSRERGVEEQGIF